MRTLFSCLLVFLSLLITIPAVASEDKFFKNIQGEWSGPGEIVAGKYKGTKFVCTFDGSNPVKKTGMMIDGFCRVGVFPQKMNAEIVKTAGTYIGKFLDGQKGDGMDVRGGRYTNNRLVVEIKRHNLDAIMIANLQDPNQLKITISVKHNDRLIPVIGINLDRTSDAIVTGSVN